MARRIGSVKSELIIKSREAMLAAVQIYNNPQITFKSESFIVLSNIAWTYLLHAYYRSIGVDYRYCQTKSQRKRYDRTKSGLYKYWELERCINCENSPLDCQTSANLRFLVGIRHEIEHQMSLNIDYSIRGKIQSCCINYNYYIKKLFGDIYGVDKELGFSIQFSEISPDQKKQLSGDEKLPKNIHNFITAFESNLSKEEVDGIRYEYKIVFQGYSSSRKSDSDKTIKFVKCDGTNVPEDVVYIKEVEKKKYYPKEIIEMMHSEGYSKFNMSSFLNLCREKNARGNREYSVNLGGRWAWYEPWVHIVKQHCLSNKEKYFSTSGK